MIDDSFKELRVAIDRIVKEMSSCSVEEMELIERQVRAAQAYIMHRGEDPKVFLERIGFMASNIAMQLRVNAAEGD
jgi:hypothetical protein